MKRLCLAVLFVFLPLAAAASAVIYFDQGANLYVIPVSGKYRGTNKDNLSAVTSKSYAGIRTLNVFVYDPKTSESRYLFDDSFTDAIIDIIFESGYNSTGKTVVYNRNGNVVNNTNIPPRAPKASILVLTTNEATGGNTLWRISKRGAGKSILQQFGKNTDWFIDTGNDKILFITQIDGTVSIIEKEWQ